MALGETRSFSSHGSSAPDFWVVKLDPSGQLTPSSPWLTQVFPRGMAVTSSLVWKNRSSENELQLGTVTVQTMDLPLKQSIQATSNARPWQDLGSGLAGENGIPHLGGAGKMTASSFGGLVLSNTRPAALAFLVVGLSRADVPFAGGTIVPQPDWLVTSLMTDVNGFLAMPFVMPSDIPSGVSFTLQAWLVDAGAIEGWASSNAVEAETR